MSNEKKEITQEVGFMATEVATTVCRMCNAGCGMRVILDGGKIIKVHGLPEDPRTEGALCAKGLAATQLIYHPDRVLHPLKRTGEKGEVYQAGGVSVPTHDDWEVARTTDAGDLRRLGYNPFR